MNNTMNNISLNDLLSEIWRSYKLNENPDWEFDGDDFSKGEVIHEIIDGHWIGEWGMKYYPKRGLWATENNLKVLEQDGGGEGGAEDCHMVFSWKGKFYRITYSYMSHNGYCYDDSELTEVKPVEKLMTIYE